MIRVATLFSGVGTPEQSLKHLKVEHETVFACEIDRFARTTYLANNQEPKTFYDDVYNIDGNIYKAQIDILIGGSPCQSFSIAGKRMGTSCPRGNLVYEYFRIVEEAKPKVFIYENVKGNDSIKRIYSSDGLCPSLTTMQGGHREPKVSIEDKYVFRKLTPRECFRLQGFDDSFIFPPKISSTQLYKQAGNGMSRNILDMIFTQIFTCYSKHIEKNINDML